LLTSLRNFFIPSLFFWSISFPHRGLLPFLVDAFSFQLLSIPFLLTIPFLNHPGTPSFVFFCSEPTVFCFKNIFSAEFRLFFFQRATLPSRFPIILLPRSHLGVGAASAFLLLLVRTSFSATRPALHQAIIDWFLVSLRRTSPPPSALLAVLS